MFFAPADSPSLLAMAITTGLPFRRCAFAAIVTAAFGCIGQLLGEIADSFTVFIQMVRTMFPAIISGALLSAILAVAMSPADFQLLASASAFASNVYKPIICKNKATDVSVIPAASFAMVLPVAGAITSTSNNFPKTNEHQPMVRSCSGLVSQYFYFVE